MTRYFDDSCDSANHEVGDRHVGGGLTIEWTGTVWAPVCPACDVPVSGRDRIGYLTCDGCGQRPADLRQAATS